MADFSRALELIKRYEGFQEKACPNPVTGGEPFVLGYGTQFYPDGSPVRQGQMVTEKKAQEYLLEELEIIDEQLEGLCLNLTSSMHQALLSFIHSIGWDNFFYSGIIESIEQEDFHKAVQDFSHWIFDYYQDAVGMMLKRRREEGELFLADQDMAGATSSDLLLAAFRNYLGAAHQVNAIRRLEVSLNPHILANFANEYRVLDTPWRYYPGDYQ
jgi:lysozyme